MDPVLRFHSRLTPICNTGVILSLADFCPFCDWRTGSRSESGDRRCLGRPHGLVGYLLPSGRPTGRRPLFPTILHPTEAARKAEIQQSKARTFYITGRKSQ